MHAYLEFERPIAELEGKIVELQKLAETDPTMDIEDDVGRLETKAKQLIQETYSKLTPWQKAQVSRHPARPHFLDYAAHLLDDFETLAGDRAFGEDGAVIIGLGRFRGRAVAVVGQEKGNDTKSRLKHNFGMAMPEGYRKAQRLFALANRFQLPVISFVDTPGAYPGVGAEERGQGEAIARSTQACLNLEVPFVSIVIGEGMSGGALGIAVANRVYMLEHAIYSVISPEGCSTILYKNAEKASEKTQEVAASLRITAQDLLEMKIIDGIVPEPVGGAHRAPEAAISAVGETIQRAFDEMNGLNAQQLRLQRREKYLAMGRNLGN